MGLSDEKKNVSRKSHDAFPLNVKFKIRYCSYFLSSWPGGVEKPPTVRT
jgi:hypothetical protein